ncbi:YlzJ-like family protein [Bacillus songklensis]|uniref:YlzJ-like family protein n=1 Tax=Bacillus songklensis TaxID=1069116 RepID=A0ABV8AY42_9BACI
MILYTMMPQELVFPMDMSIYGKQKVIDINGLSMIVMENDQKQYEVVRLLSTNPQDYLNNRYYPGQIINASF